MVLAAGPWALLGHSASYLIKLAPLLWWALPSSQQRKLAAKANRPSPGTQYPDKRSNGRAGRTDVSIYEPQPPSISQG
ncbi:hypothetical protein DSO57_1023851, partial [Entomophthora muscae]